MTEEPRTAAAAQPAPAGHLLRGSAWMITMRWSIRGLGLVSTVILARVLTPEDFGIVAMAMVVIGFLEVFTQTGVDLALIRDRAATRAHFDTAWTLEILQAAALALALLIVAPFAAAWFDDPRVTLVIRLLALRALIGGFENIGVVAFRRELDFSREFWFGVVKKTATVAITITIALWLRSYWALVIGLVGGRLLDVLISFRMHPYRPRWCLERVREIWSFSQWLLLARVANVVNRKFDEFVVGGQAGTSAMGTYFVASDIATAPTEEIVLPMARGTFPVYSRTLDRRDELAEAFRGVLATTAYLCCALGLGLASVAAELVPLVLGEQWLATIPLMQALGACGVGLGIAFTFDPLLWASGRADISAKYKWVQLALMIPAVLVGVSLGGVLGIALAKTAVVFALLPLLIVWVARAEGIRVGPLVAALAPAFASGIAMVIAVRAIADALEGAGWWALVAEVAGGAVVFLSFATLLWVLRGRPEGPERRALARFVAKV